MMESLSYLLSIIAILGAASGITRVAFSASLDGETDRGRRTLLVPLVAISLTILLDHLRLYGPGMDTKATWIALGFIRRSMGAAWLYFCTAHYRLYQKESARHRFMPLIVSVSLAANFCYALLNALVGEGYWNGATMMMMIVIAFYAGCDAVLLSIRHGASLPSSKAGVRIAMMTMVVYPVVVVSDLAGVRFPGLSPNQPIWSQTNPLYLLALLAILEPALATRRKQDSARTDETANPFESLSAREAETVRLIMQGNSYKEITVLLGITLPTVKSHASNAYRKLGVKSRSQLYRLTRP